LGKEGTPTMGGTLILGSILISTFLWGDLTNFYIWILILIVVGFGTIGFIDDYRKLTRKNSKGLSGKMKLSLQIVMALAEITSREKDLEDIYSEIENEQASFRDAEKSREESAQ
jgi:phospho-N-acetylmuramoyl-pentapeptide-transferase